jgi:hypothetical protein
MQGLQGLDVDKSRLPSDDQRYRRDCNVLGNRKSRFSLGSSRSRQAIWVCSRLIDYVLKIFPLEVVGVANKSEVWVARILFSLGQIEQVAKSIFEAVITDRMVYSLNFTFPPLAFEVLNPGQIWCALLSLQY